MGRFGELTIQAWAAQRADAAAQIRARLEERARQMDELRHEWRRGLFGERCRCCWTKRRPDEEGRSCFYKTAQPY